MILDAWVFLSCLYSMTTTMCPPTRCRQPLQITEESPELQALPEHLRAFFRTAAPQRLVLGITHVLQCGLQGRDVGVRGDDC